MFCFRLPHAASGLSWSQAAVLSGHSTPPPRLLDLDSHQLGQVWANITGHEHNLNSSINVHSENFKHIINPFQRTAQIIKCVVSPVCCIKKYKRGSQP